MKVHDSLLRKPLEIVNVFLLFVMTVVVAVEVFLRYVLNTGITWSFEFVAYCYVWLVFLGSVTAIDENAHIAFGLAVNSLPTQLKRVVLCLGDVLTMFFIGIMTVYGFQHVMKTAGIFKSRVMQIPMSWVYLVFPISGFLMFIEMIRVLLRHAKADGRGEK